MTQGQLLSALMALHNADHADAADYMAKQLGLHYEYTCWCYGDMSRQEYDDIIEAGRQYALEHASERGDSVINLRVNPQG